MRYIKLPPRFKEAFHQPYKLHTGECRGYGTWRIKTNQELEMLIRKKNIVRFIKSQRLRWAVHVIRMDTTRTVKKLTEWEPCSSRPVGRPRLRWLDQVEEDLTLRLLMSYIYGAPSKERNANVVYIWTYVWQR